MAPSEDALRDAARELIAAGRSLLDAAEAVLDDPAATERVVSVMSVIAQQAQAMVAGVVQGAADRFGASDESS